MTDADEMSSALAAHLAEDGVIVKSELDDRRDDEASVCDALPDYDIDVFIPDIKEELFEAADVDRAPDTTGLPDHEEADHIAYTYDKSALKDVKNKVPHLLRYKQFHCKECGKTFTDSCSVTAHRRIHKGLKAYTCEECGKVFSSSRSLTKHVNTHLGEECDEKPTVYKKNGVKSCLEITDTCQKIFHSNKCEKTFNNRIDVIQHVKIRNPFVCEVCGKNFNYSGNFKTHKRIHTGLKPYRCDECGRAFNEKGNLNRHIKSHRNEKRCYPEVELFSCGDCGKKFVTRDRLAQHTTIHSDVKPYRCDECGVSFRRRGEITSHMVVHSRATPFKCDKCGRSFSRNGVLKKHKLVHTLQRFPCDQCVKSYSRMSDLKVHRLVHTGDKSFACEDCGKRFYSKTCLTKHKKFHQE